MSAHFRDRRGRRRGRRSPTWPKLTILVHTGSHLVAAAIPSRGPCVDHLEYVPALAEALQHLPLDLLLADAGYDAEHSHVWGREFFGISRTLVALNRRHAPLPPKTQYRREIHFDLPKDLYGQRWQAESAISRHKRRLGSSLRTRSDSRQANELRLRFLTHNLMILKRPRGEVFDRATAGPHPDALTHLLQTRYDAPTLHLVMVTGRVVVKDS